MIHFCTVYSNDDTPLWRAHVFIYSEPSGKILYAATEGIAPDACTYHIPRSDIPPNDTVIHINITNTYDNTFTHYSADIIKFNETTTSFSEPYTEPTEETSEFLITSINYSETTDITSDYSESSVQEKKELSLPIIPIIFGIMVISILLKWRRY